MPIETFNYIDSLNSSNPGSSDDVLQGDDHIRGIKAVLKNTFPNITAAINATAGQLNQLTSFVIPHADGTAGAPAIYWLTEPTLGFYRYAASILAVTGRLIGNGAVDAGSMHTFPKTPPGGMASGGSATGSERYVLGDGSVYNIATFPQLGAYLGSTYGGNGTTTFGVPDLVTTHRFIRAAGGSLGVGTTQSSAIKSHSSALSGTAATHTHALNGSGASVSMPGLSGGNNVLTTDVTGDIVGGVSAGTQYQRRNLSLSGGGSLSGSTGASGALALSGTADYSGDSTETRPEAFAAYICLKT
jgi:microcystin-dependent protein